MTNIVILHRLSLYCSQRFNGEIIKMFMASSFSTQVHKNGGGGESKGRS